MTGVFDTTGHTPTYTQRHRQQVLRGLYVQDVLAYKFGWEVAPNFDSLSALVLGETGVSYPDDNIYRVLVKPKGELEVLCFGIDNKQPLLGMYYSGVDALPAWANERLALLSMLPMSAKDREIEHIGRRIGPNVYWLYAPEPSEP